MAIPEVGERVRVDIPDKTDPDFKQYHRRCGMVIEIIPDDVSKMTGDDRDSVLYRVKFDDGSVQDFRWRDLRPVPE